MNQLEKFNSRMEATRYIRHGGGDNSLPLSASSSIPSSGKGGRTRGRASPVKSAKSPRPDTNRLKADMEQLKSQVKRLQATNVLLRKNFSRDKLDKDLIENMDLAQMLEASAIEAQIQLKQYEAGNHDEYHLSPKVQAYVNELKSDAQRLRELLEREVKRRTQLQQAYDFIKTCRDKTEEEYRRLKKEEEQRMSLPTISDQRQLIGKYESMISDLKQEVSDKESELRNHRGKLPELLGHRSKMDSDEISKLQQAIYMLKKELEEEKKRSEDIERLENDNLKLRVGLQKMREQAVSEGVRMEKRKLDLGMDRQELDEKEERIREMEMRLSDRSSEAVSSTLRMSTSGETVRLQQELTKRRTEWENDRKQASLKINELRSEISQLKQLVKKQAAPSAETSKSRASLESRDSRGRQPAQDLQAKIKSLQSQLDKKVGVENELKAAKKALTLKERQLTQSGNELAKLQRRLNQASAEPKSSGQAKRPANANVQQKLIEEKALHVKALKEVQDLERACHDAFEKLVKTEGDAKEAAKKHKEILQQKDKAIDDLKREALSVESSIVAVRAEMVKLRKENEGLKLRLSEQAQNAQLDNNANIADLGDEIRPTILAEQYSELYANEWTDAFEEQLPCHANDVIVIRFLLDILLDAYSFCQELCKDQTRLLTHVLLSIPGEQLPASDTELPVGKKRKLKELRKLFARDLAPSVAQHYKAKRGSTLEGKAQTERYVDSCVRISWLMCAQDPPVVLKETGPEGAQLDPELYRAYTNSGNTVDYFVWPVLLLHHDGPVLCKGVAQGK